MKKKFIDPNIKNKSVTVENRIQLINFYDKKLPLPTEIEISESGTCNRKCSFCPRSDPEFIHRKEFISDELHLKLCNELQELDYKGTIRYSGFVEPLLDKNIFNLIKIAKTKLPGSNIELVTNGDVLNLLRLKKLFTSGLNKILISAYDGKKEADKLEEICIKAKLTSNQFIVRHRYLNESQDFGITLSNRSGSMKNGMTFGNGQIQYSSASNMTNSKSGRVNLKRKKTTTVRNKSDITTNKQQSSSDWDLQNHQNLDVVPERLNQFKS